MNILQTIIKAAKAITRVSRIISRVTGGKKKKAAAHDEKADK